MSPVVCGLRRCDNGRQGGDITCMIAESWVMLNQSHHANLAEIWRRMLEEEKVLSSTGPEDLNLTKARKRGT